MEKKIYVPETKRLVLGGACSRPGVPSPLPIAVIGGGIKELAVAAEHMRLNPWEAAPANIALVAAALKAIKEILVGMGRIRV